LVKDNAVSAVGCFSYLVDVAYF